MYRRCPGRSRYHQEVVIRNVEAVPVATAEAEVTAFSVATAEVPEF